MILSCDDSVAPLWKLTQRPQCGEADNQNNESPRNTRNTRNTRKAKTFTAFFPRISRGYEFCQLGVLKNSGHSSCRTGGSWATLRTCWSANQQVGFREMLEEYHWSNSPLSRMSTGAKHLHGDRPAYLSACKRLTRWRPSA